MRCDRFPARAGRGAGLALLVAYLCVLAPGCSVLARLTPTPPLEPVRVRFAFHPSQQGYYEPLIAMFNEEHPDITVEPRTTRTQDTLRSLLRDREADAYVLYAYDDQFAQLYEQGDLLNLTPLIEQDERFDLSDFNPGVVGACRREGEMWAIPFGVNLMVMYYNKDLFDRYGVPYPEMSWTWDDFVSAALLLRDPDEGIYGCAADGNMTIPLVYQHGGRLLDDWENPTRTTFDDPLTIEALEWYAELIHDYDVIPTPEEANRLYGRDGAPAYVFWRGKAAMYLGSINDRGGESWGGGARWQMEWGMVPLPRDERAATIGFVEALVLSSDIAHPEAGWKWIKFLSAQMPQWTMPARRSSIGSSAYVEQVGPEVAAVGRASIEDVLIVSSVHTQLGEAFQGYTQAVEDITSGETAPMEAMLQAQERSPLQ
ncbi:MAG: sugar ABC transporter substrate-binding protein [Anaerolineae bacterium]|nr:sugar ABC transporter substrate-binding protein [Anaerolineae bacterium]